GAAQRARAGGARADRSRLDQSRGRRQLFISQATVKTHLVHIYGKLGVKDRAAAVAAGYDRGLLTPRSRSAVGETRSFRRSLVAAGRNGLSAAAYVRTLTARAMTKSRSAVETSDSIPIKTLAHRESGIVSVGLTASELVRET